MNVKGLFQLYPLVPLVLCLIIGITAGRFLLCHVDCFVWIVSVVISLIICFSLYKYPYIQSHSILLVSFLTGCSLISVAERNYRRPLPDGEIRYNAVVASEPVERGKTLRFDMIVSTGPLCGRIVRASLLKDTVTNRYKRLCVGDGLTASSEMKSPVNFIKSDFDYVTYLKAHGVVAQTFIFHNNWRMATVSLRNLNMWQRSRLCFMRFRHKIMEQYRTSGLTGQSFAITAAMTLGHRTDISPDLREAYSAAGVSHVLALSGMHLSIIYFLLSVLFVGRRFVVMRESLLVISIWAFVFMVGMPPSVVRSAIMITIYSVVGLTGRNRMSLNVLAFAALIMLVMNPFSLYDIGFQLSFISVAAILIFHRPVCGIVSLKFQQRHPLFRKLWNLIVMSCSAQLASAPLVAYYFGTVSLYFLLSNLVAIPAVTVILYLTVLMLAMSFIPVVRQVTVALLMLVSTSLNTFLFRVASLPGAVVTNLHISTIQLFIIYVIIVSLCLICRLMYKGVFRYRRQTDL